MSAPEDAPPPPPKRRKWRRTIAYAAGGVAVASGLIVALGPAAPWIIDNLADGRRVWRLGNIQVDGVSGSWLGALRAERVAIADEEGVWLEATDIALEWSPQDILVGNVDLDLARASTITVLRQPRLAEKRPSSGADFNIRIDTLDIGTLALNEPVLGQAATFTANFALDLHGEDLRLLNLDLRRTDSEADRIVALYRPDADYAFNIDIEGQAGGILSRALGVPEQDVRARAQGEGDASVGAVTYQASIGAAPTLTGTSRWTAERWETQNQAQLDHLPALETIAQRIGASITLTASGERVGAFEAHAETPFLALDLSGALDENRALVGPARFVATTMQLSDIARESPFSLGAARIEGELRRARGTTAIRGTLDTQQIDALGQSVRLSGPIEASLSDESFDLAADLRAPARSPALFANAQLRTSLSYDRARRRFALDRAELTGDALALNAQGWVNGDDGEFSGEWRVRQLGAVVRELRGEAGGRWRAFAGENRGARVWTIAVDGAGAGIGGRPDIIPQLVGATPRIDARLAYENGGLTVSHARVDGANLRAGATGRIVRGEANLALEASARGPLNLGGAEINGAVDATGRLTGRIARPTLSANATMSSFSAGGVIVEQPQLTFTLAPSGRAYAGRAEVQGGVAGKPMVASANVSIVDSAIAMSDLLAQLAELEARGSATLAPGGVTADVTLTGALDGLAPGVAGRIDGDLTLTPERIVLDAQLTDARTGELRLRAATLHAEGPLDAIAARFDLRGRLREAPLAFGGAANVTRDGGATTLVAEGIGTLADAEIASRTPMRMVWSRGAMDAALDFAVAGGAGCAPRRGRGGAAAPWRLPCIPPSRPAPSAHNGGNAGAPSPARRRSTTPRWRRSQRSGASARWVA
jgi:translocation and assembly module TamB